MALTKAFKKAKSIGFSPPITGCHKSGLPVLIAVNVKKKIQKTNSSKINMFFFSDNNFLTREGFFMYINNEAEVRAIKISAIQGNV